MRRGPRSVGWLARCGARARRWLTGGYCVKGGHMRVSVVLLRVAAPGGSIECENQYCDGSISIVQSQVRIMYWPATSSWSH